MGTVDDAARDYIEGIPAERRPLFDRIHDLILGVHPEAEVILSYRMPTYCVGRRRLYVGAWKHGVSFYGWEEGRDAGFTARHPELSSGKGTIRLRPADAAGIDDDELRDLIRAELDA